MKPPKLSLATIFWLTAALLLAMGLTALVWPHAKSVETAIIDRGPVQYALVDQGRTRIHDIYIVSTPVAGEVQRVRFEVGDRVQKNQPVADILPASPLPLDARTLAETRAGVLAAEAAVSAAAADDDMARRDQARAQTLYDKGYVSPAALDAANMRLASASAALQARRAELRQAQAAAGGGLSSAQAAIVLRSPVAGRVLQLHQKSEAVLLAGAPVLDVGDPTDMEIVAEFLSQDAMLMKPGDPAFIEDWGGSAPIPATVTRIEPSAHTKISALGVEEQRVNVIARLQDPASAPVFGDGFRVNLRVIVSRQTDVTRAPVDALVRDGAGWAVFRVMQGKALLTPVRVEEAGDAYRRVISGLTQGDEVVLYPGDALKSGDRVTSRRDG